MYGVSMTIEGDRQAFADLSRFMTMLDKPFLDDRLIRDLQREFFKAESEQFRTEGRASGKPWPKLSPRYKRWKDKHYPGKKILERTGRLRESLTSREGDTIHQVERGGKRLTLGSTVKYAVYHQSTRPRRRLPRRAPIEFDKDQQVAFMRVIQRAITRSAREKMSTTWEVRAGVGT